ncbi:MAG: hypothetical protein ABF652_21310, partial [Clostridium beijerinckii]
SIKSRLLISIYSMNLFPIKIPSSRKYILDTTLSYKNRHKIIINIRIQLLSSKYKEKLSAIFLIIRNIIKIYIKYECLLERKCESITKLAFLSPTNLR